MTPEDRGGLSGRSIPACAGEPDVRIAHRASPRVYPRVCGGTRSTSRHASRHSGLSPRVRGNRLRKHPPDAGEGSIPACAGEPCSFGPA